MRKPHLWIIMIVFASFSMSAQDQTILFGQQKAINNLSSDAGLSNNNLDSYLKKRYNRPLYQLTQSEGVEIIKGFQDGTISKNSVLEYINPQRQVVENTQSISQQGSAQSKDLIAASVLEVVMLN